MGKFMPFTTNPKHAKFESVWVNISILTMHVFDEVERICNKRKTTLDSFPALPREFIQPLISNTNKRNSSESQRAVRKKSPRLQLLGPLAVQAAGGRRRSLKDLVKAWPLPWPTLSGVGFITASAKGLLRCHIRITINLCLAWYLQGW